MQLPLETLEDLRATIRLLAGLTDELERLGARVTGIQLTIAENGIELEGIDAIAAWINAQESAVRSQELAAWAELETRISTYPPDTTRSN